MGETKQPEATGSGTEPTRSVATERDGPTPKRKAAQPAARPLSQGTTVGRYLLLEKIGEGGMGMVYAAYDPQLHRKIAIKLVHGARANDPNGQARLLREAQALAKLSHANVVSVHDAGTFEDNVFIAMDLVEGQSVRSWLKKDHPSWRQVVAAFTQAARGLIAAHACGLVHRDLKPDNFLIDKTGRVYVSDFGLVRQTTDDHPPAPPEIDSSSSALSSSLTQEGRIMGTRGYMPPEAFTGVAIDQAGDQFSFCVTLYEALYGERPFDARPLSEQPEPHKAPRQSRVPPWLRRAVVRGLAHLPRDRHPSMAALLVELERDPAPRNRRIALAAVTTVLVGGAVVAYQRADARRETMCKGAGDALRGVWDPERRLALRSIFVATGGADGGGVFDRVQQIVDGYADAWVGMRTEACEATRVRGEQSDDALGLRMGCLDRRLGGLKAYVEVFSTPDLPMLAQAVKAAHALSPIADCADLAVLGLPVRPPEDVTARARVEALRPMLAQEKALFDAGKYVQAIQIAGPALEGAVAVRYRPLEAELRYWRARAEASAGKYKEAEQSDVRALTAAQAGGHLEFTARALAHLASMTGALGRTAEGLRWAELGHATLERMGANPEIEAELENATGACLAKQDPATALRHYERSRDLWLQRSGTTRPDVAKVYWNIGTIYAGRADYPNALAAYRESIKIAEALVGPNHPLTMLPISGISDVLLALGRYDEAEPYLARIATMESRGRQAVIEGKGIIALARGQYASALAQFVESKELYEHSLVKEQRYITPNLLCRISATLSRLGRHPEAIDAAQQAVKIRETNYPADSPFRAPPYQALGTALTAAGRAPAAVELHQRALELWRVAKDQHETDAHDGLGRAYLALGRAAEAAGELERARDLRDARMGRDHPDTAATLAGLGRALVALGRTSDAVPALERGLAIATAARLAPRLRAELRFALAQARWQTGARDQARALAEQALADDAADERPSERAAIAAWLADHP